MPSPTLFPTLAGMPSSFFEGFDSDQRFTLVIVSIVFLAGLLIAVISIVSGTISSIQKRSAELELKRDMLDRGMSSEEIQQVIESSPLPPGRVWPNAGYLGRQAQKVSNFLRFSQVPRARSRPLMV